MGSGGASLSPAPQLSQHELGKELGVSAMTISRWEGGKAKPPADAYIGLGNLAGDPTCWHFWSRAGLNKADVLRVMPHAAPPPVKRKPPGY
jgi:hypothetical protein